MANSLYVNLFYKNLTLKRWYYLQNIIVYFATFIFQYEIENFIQSNFCSTDSKLSVSQTQVLYNSWSKNFIEIHWKTP